MDGPSKHQRPLLSASAAVRVRAGSLSLSISRLYRRNASAAAAAQAEILVAHRAFPAHHRVYYAYPGLALLREPVGDPDGARIRALLHREILGCSRNSSVLHSLPIIVWHAGRCHQDVSANPPPAGAV